MSQTTCRCHELHEVTVLDVDEAGKNRIHLAAELLVPHAAHVLKAEFSQEQPGMYLALAMGAFDLENVG